LRSNNQIHRDIKELLELQSFFINEKPFSSWRETEFAFLFTVE
jgi:hypothetical protein